MLNTKWAIDKVNLSLQLFKIHFGTNCKNSEQVSLVYSVLFSSVLPSPKQKGGCLYNTRYGYVDVPDT